MSFVSAVGGFFSGIRDWFADPKTAAAIVNVEHVAEAIVCDIAGASGLALTIEELAAVQAATGVTGEIYAVSGAVCTALGGSIVTGKTASNVAAVTAVAAPK